MASSVFYKFRSQRDESRVTFDGTGISVFDLKKEIILANNLGKANDFDLAVLDKSSGEEFRDDSHIIPRSSSVIVKRVPAARPGKGKAAMYIGAVGGAASSSDAAGKSGGSGGSGSSWYKGTMSRRFDSKDEHRKDEHPPQKPAAAPLAPVIATGDESAAMNAMFQAQAANWEETQEKMSQLVSRHAISLYPPNVSTLTLAVPVSIAEGNPSLPIIINSSPSDLYLPVMSAIDVDRKVCLMFNAFERRLIQFEGHWIQDCPTNNDRDFDHKPRIKRTTGIPRSFLKAVDNPAGNQIGHGVMVTPEGGYVVAQPDSASWQKQVMRPKGLTETDIRERPSKDPSIVCSIDNTIFRDAVKTPCCEKTFCEECIQTYLLEKDFICPSCGTKIASLDKLIMDKPTRARVADYIEREIEASRKEEDGTTNNGTPAQSAGHTPQPEPSTSDPQQQQQQQLQQLQQQQQNDFYSEQGQLADDLSMSQMIVDNIPQLQAQVAQISAMLQDPTLPNHVRHKTEMQHQQLQVQLSQAQTMAAVLAAAQMQAAQVQAQVQQVPGPSAGVYGGGGQYGHGHGQQGGMWGGSQFSNQQPASHESAYQRLPLNNRRRNLKRDRPSDFLEIAGQNDGKVARYWE
ncbi:hypothetical protein EVG20_g4833 [Dentipellis fragilis]|uniref:DWNN domain-containing protein n=1 Tax=Dentipellis fragilis TaxID=205917 RepID=A0A4Y9YWY0_9AGAM|nr:hypothetical protein EVG20_g4833 [Dentipellis fragilis]